MTTWEFQRADDPVTYRATFADGLLETDPIDTDDAEYGFDNARNRLDQHGILRTFCVDEAAAVRELRAFEAEFL